MKLSCSNCIPVFALTALTLAATNAMAEDRSVAIGSKAGSFLIRGHVLGIFPENSCSSIEAIGGVVDVASRVAPEVDLSYFFTDHLAAQLIATLTRTSIKASGTRVGDISVGNVTVLPPTLTAQYHFTPDSAFSPYVAAGVTAFILFDTKPDPAAGVVTGLHANGSSRSFAGLPIRAGSVRPRWLRSKSPGSFSGSDGCLTPSEPTQNLLGQEIIWPRTPHGSVRRTISPPAALISPASCI